MCGLVIYIWHSGSQIYDEVHWLPGRICLEEARSLAITKLHANTDVLKVQAAIRDHVIIEVERVSDYLKRAA
jgi:hypothetical protein